MAPILHAFSLLSAAAVSGLASAIWEGSILALCVFGCLRIFPRLSAASRSFVWIMVFLLLMLLHIVPAIRAGGGAAMQEHASTFYIDLRWSLAIAALWAVLSVWKSTQLILSAMSLHRVACCASLLPSNPALQALLQERDDADRSTYPVELYTSVEVERPCVVGFLRPRILIPHALLHKLSALELRQVVLHEMEHLHRGDVWTNLLQKIGMALFPLNPVLLWVDGRVCAERELACDDRVLRSSGARREYATCLTRMAEYALVRRSVSLVLGAWERQSELVHRVRRLLRGPSQSMSSRQAALVTGCVLCGVLSGAMALAHSPQLISFVPLAESETHSHGTQATAVGFSQPEFVKSSAAPQLVKAVTHQQPVQKAVRAKLIRKPVPRRNVQQHFVQDQAQWIVLTEWSVSDAPPRVVYAVEQSNRQSYAALATPMGWLIVQI